MFNSEGYARNALFNHVFWGIAIPSCAFVKKKQDKGNLNYLCSSPPLVSIQGELSCQYCKDLKIPLWNYNTIIQQHLNIMRSTCELLTSDFVELEMTLLDCV